MSKMRFATGVALLAAVALAGCTSTAGGTGTAPSARVIPLTNVPAEQNVSIPPGGFHDYPRVQSSDCKRLRIYVDGVTHTVVGDDPPRVQVFNYGASSVEPDGLVEEFGMYGLDARYAFTTQTDLVVGPVTGVRIKGGPASGATISRLSLYCTPY